MGNSVERRKIYDRVNAWLIRATDSSLIIPEGVALYFMSHLTWTADPTSATIFKDYESAGHEMFRARMINIVTPTTILDIVTLVGAIAHQERKRLT